MLRPASCVWLQNYYLKFLKHVEGEGRGIFEKGAALPLTLYIWKRSGATHNALYLEKERRYRSQIWDAVLGSEPTLEVLYKF